MRLNRFDLTRYGLFTDFSISLGGRPESGSDFHIVYGPNEAGKSTFRAAFLDLMFGIERQSVYNFKHSYSTMRVGAALEINDKTHELIRVKKEKNSLLGADDQPLSDTVLAAALGSVTRDGYETMFSLDDDTLQQGGDSILQSKGDLGQLLFSAASGLSDLGMRLGDVRTEAHAFYRAGTRRHGLADAKKRLQDLKDEKSKRDLQASQFVALTKEEAAARARHEAAKAERDAARGRRQHVARVLAARAAWADLKMLQAKLDALQGTPDLPEGWLTEAQALSTQFAAAESEARLAEKTVERLAEEQDALQVDDTILGLRQEIERLRDHHLEPRYVTAEDIPSREQERDAVAKDLSDTVRRLGCPSSDDPASLLLPSTTAVTLDRLVERRTAVFEAQGTAAEERDKAEARLARAAKQLKDLGDEVDLAGLSAVVRGVRSAGHDKEIARLERRVGTLKAELDGAVTRLAPWSGSVDALSDLVPPAAGQIGEWQATLSQRRNGFGDLERRLADRIDARDRSLAEVEAIGATTGVLDDAAAADARAGRAAAWQTHRAGLNDDGAALATLRTTADAFEKAMDEDDRVADTRLRQSTDAATLRESQGALIRLAAEIENLEAKIAAERTRLKSEETRVAAALSGLGLPGDMALEALSSWLDRRVQAVQKSAELREAMSDLAAARDNRSTDVARLAASMNSAGLDVDKDASIDISLDGAEGEIERRKTQANDIRSARKALAEAEADFEDRSRTSSRTVEYRQSWETEWRVALKSCWLGERQSTEEVAEILRILRILPGTLEKRDDLTRRVDKMKVDRDRYVAAVAALAERAGLSFDAARPLQAADQLRSRLDEAARNDSLRDTKRQERDKAAAEHRGADAKRQIIQTRFDEMTDRYPSQNFTELLENLQKAGENSRYVTQIESRESELLDALDCVSLVDAEAFLEKETSDSEALKVEVARLDSELADHDEMVSELFHMYQTAHNALASVSGDADVARIEESRRTELLHIKEQADRYLALSIGALAAEDALRAFRDRHRSSMMKRAGRAFATITRNAFTDLTTTPGKDGELLVGLKAGSGSMAASEMSKGTCFQLYLALRIAGYAEFVQDREALPFFADDILETFDDDRSAETFRLLSEMAHQGQVIYLTHHRHLCDIAEQVCGDAVTIHELL